VFTFPTISTVSNKFVESIIPSVEANPGSPGNAATILLYERTIFGRPGSMELISAGAGVKIYQGPTIG
jgi:hypothetical protein